MQQPFTRLRAVCDKYPAPPPEDNLQVISLVKDASGIKCHQTFDLNTRACLHLFLLSFYQLTQMMPHSPSKLHLPEFFFCADKRDLCHIILLLLASEKD